MEVTRSSDSVSSPESCFMHPGIAKAITDNVTTSLFMTDAQGYCTFMNPAAERLTGFTFEEAAGRILHELIHHTRSDGQSYPLEECWMMTVLTQGQRVQDREDVFIRKDGMRFPVICTASPIMAEGRVNGVVLEIRDITERKKAIMALAESERRFEKIADASPMMMGVWDRDCNATFISQAWLDFVGLDRETAMRAGWMERVHPDDHDRVVQGWRNVFARHEQLTSEYRVRAADETYRWVYSVAMPRFSAGGDFIGFFVSSMDIHDKKLAEDEVRTYARKLEQSNRDLEQFATIASHDLQAPLRKIATFTGYIQEQAMDGMSDECKDYFRRIQHASNKMQQLVSDLLNLSRVNRKGQPFRKTYMNEVMQRVLTDLKYVIRETHGELEIGDLGIIDADPAQMQQLFQNLIGNALKFQRKDQPPLVKVYVAQREGNHCTFVVEDNGIGIKPFQVEKIYQPFVRLHGESEYEGSGIGLTICRKIVDRHGGEIQVESEPGEGTRFFIQLPIQQA